MICLLFLSFSTKMVFCAFLGDVEMEENGPDQSTIRLGSLKRRRSKELDGETEAKIRCLSSPEQQREKDTKLWQEITDGDLKLDAVEGILAAKANPNAWNKEGMTPIYYLVSDIYGSSLFNNVSYNRQRHKEYLKFDSGAIAMLLKNRADPNLINGKNGCTALHVTASDYYLKYFWESEHYDATSNMEYLTVNLARAKTLLKYGANPDAKGGKDNNSALHFAVANFATTQILSRVHVPYPVYFNRKKELLKVLLDANANVNIRDACDGTPLHQSAMVEHCPTVDLLLEYGADVGVREKSSGWMPIHMAATSLFHFLAGMTLLQHGADLGAKTLTEDTVLSLSGNEYCTRIIKKIKRRGIEKNKLFLAILLSPNARLVSKLIAKNIEVNQTDAEGETPLMYAARETRSNLGFEIQSAALDIVRQLLIAGADSQIKKGDGTTASSLASDEGKVIIKNFITVGKRKESRNCPLVHLSSHVKLYNLQRR